MNDNSTPAARPTIGAPSRRFMSRAPLIALLGLFYPSLLQNHGAIGGPAQVHLVAPIDGPLRGALIILRKNGHELSGFGFDAIGRAIAEIAHLPDYALDLIEAVAGERLLAQADFLRPQCHPNALPAAEAAQLVDDQIATGLGAAHDEVPGLAAAHGTLEQIGGADEVGHAAGLRKLIDLRRSADLHDLAAIHDRDARRQRHRFVLVVCDEHERDAHLILDVHQLEL